MMTHQDIASWSLGVTQATNLTPNDSILEFQLASPDTSCDLDREDPGTPVVSPRSSKQSMPSTQSTFYSIRAQFRSDTSPNKQQCSTPIRLWVGPWTRPVPNSDAAHRAFWHKQCAQPTIPRHRWQRFVACDGRLWVDWGWSYKSYEDSVPRYFLRCKHCSHDRPRASCRALRARAESVAMNLETTNGKGFCRCSLLPILGSEELKIIFRRDAWKCGPAMQVKEVTGLDDRLVAGAIEGMSGRHALYCKVLSSLSHSWRWIRCAT